MLNAMKRAIIAKSRELIGINFVIKQMQELKYATIFHDTVVSGGWFDAEKCSFSLGNWAVGYNYYYVGYRILNEMHPKSILELGLGQSTKITGAYAGNFECEHTVIEHDEEWKNFYCQSNGLSSKTNIAIVPLTYEHKNIADGYNDLRYDEQSFKKAVDGRKFDLISIDEPYGIRSDKPSGKPYSRVDILDYLPQCLCDNFAIMIDDYDREGEQNLVYEIEKKLSDGNIAFKKGTYRGETELCVIASKDWKFLCSL